MTLPMTPEKSQQATRLWMLACARLVGMGFQPSMPYTPDGPFAEGLMHPGLALTTNRLNMLFIRHLPRGRFAAMTVTLHSDGKLTAYAETSMGREGMRLSGEARDMVEELARQAGQS